MREAITVESLSVAAAKGHIPVLQSLRTLLSHATGLPLAVPSVSPWSRSLTDDFRSHPHGRRGSTRGIDPTKGLFGNYSSHFDASSVGRMS